MFFFPRKHLAFIRFLFCARACALLLFTSNEPRAAPQFAPYKTGISQLTLVKAIQVHAGFTRHRGPDSLLHSSSECKMSTDTNNDVACSMGIGVKDYAA